VDSARTSDQYTTIDPRKVMNGSVQKRKKEKKKPKKIA
jgi:hypothetical protein